MFIPTSQLLRSAIETRHRVTPHLTQNLTGNDLTGRGQFSFRVKWRRRVTRPMRGGECSKKLKRLTDRPTGRRPSLSLPSPPFYGLDRSSGGGGGELAVVVGFQKGSARGGGGGNAR